MVNFAVRVSPMAVRTSCDQIVECVFVNLCVRTNVIDVDLQSHGSEASRSDNRFQSVRRASLALESQGDLSYTNVRSQRTSAAPLRMLAVP